MRKLLVALGCAIAIAVTGCAPSTAEPASKSASESLSESAASGTADAPAESPTGDPSLCPEAFGATDTSVAADDRLPNVSLSCLTADKKLAIDGAPGVPTVVNFWAAWCAPCRTEIPILQEFYTAAAGKVLVLGIVTSDTRKAGTEFVGDENVTFPNLIDRSGTVMLKLGLTGLPNSLLVNAKGEVVDKHIGPFKDGSELRAAVKNKLGVEIA